MQEKVGVKQHYLTPHSRKWGSVDPLTPVLPRSMTIYGKTLTKHNFTPLTNSRFNNNVT